MTRLLPFALLVLLIACSSTSGSGTDDTPEADRPTGQSIFNMNCSLCHGRDGKLGLNGARDLTISTLTKEEMLAVVRNGKGAMMPYKDVLTAKEIEAVVEHVRTLGKPK